MPTDTTTTTTSTQLDIYVANDGSLEKVFCSLLVVTLSQIYIIAYGFTRVSIHA
jgi:hypothetical protein